MEVVEVVVVVLVAASTSHSNGRCRLISNVAQMFALNSTLFSSSVDKLRRRTIMTIVEHYHSYLILRGLHQLSILEWLVEQLTLKVNSDFVHRNRLVGDPLHDHINTLTSKSIVMLPSSRVADLKSK